MLQFTINHCGFFFAKHHYFVVRISGGQYLWRLEVWEFAQLLHTREYHPTMSDPNQRTLDDAKRDAWEFVFNHSTLKGYLDHDTSTQSLPARDRQRQQPASDVAPDDH